MEKIELVRKKRSIPVFLLLGMTFLWLAVPVKGAEPSPRKWTAGLNIAGVGLGYRSSRWATEIRGQALPDIVIGGVREYFIFRPRLGVLPYIGLEGNYIRFNSDNSEGIGFIAAAFLGAEYFFAKRWSATLDMGPGWVSMEDDKTTADENGLDIILNLGINLHFGEEVSR